MPYSFAQQDTNRAMFLVDLATERTVINRVHKIASKQNSPDGITFGDAKGNTTILDLDTESVATDEDASDKLFNPDDEGSINSHLSGSLNGEELDGLERDALEADQNSNYELETNLEAEPNDLEIEPNEADYMNSEEDDSNAAGSNITTYSDEGIDGNAGDTQINETFIEGSKHNCDHNCDHDCDHDCEAKQSSATAEDCHHSTNGNFKTKLVPIPLVVTLQAFGLTMAKSAMQQEWHSDQALPGDTTDPEHRMDTSCKHTIDLSLSTASKQQSSMLRLPFHVCFFHMVI
eukprot:jgi/Psemu1/18687/gm1.18687_g